jgi:hypothetical protein
MMNRREAIAATFAALVLPSGEEIVNCSGYNLDEFYPPFMVVDMPLNSLNQGPETRPEMVAKTVYQVWDSAFQALDEFESEYVAMQVSWQLNVNCGFRDPKLPF